MNIKHILHVSAYLILLFGCTREQPVPVIADFTYEVINNNFSVPVQIIFKNQTAGANKFYWTFNGGSLSTSNKKDPGTIEFNKSGSYTITLEAWNEDNYDKKEVQIQLDEAISVDFDASVEENDFAPVTINIQNKSFGASTFQWTFENGNPASSTLKNPGKVIFNTPGEHTITLVAGNGRKHFTVSKKVLVKEPIQPDFEIIPSFEDDDFEAPFTGHLMNKTKSGLTWSWSSTGGSISDISAKEPTLSFTTPGTYTVSLIASNNKETKQVSHSITILPNTNLRTFTNMRLGINTAHATIGSFFSTKLRRHFTSADDLSLAGKDIDIAFFGLNENFTYNKFITPDSAQYYTFPTIPQSKKVKFINVLEACLCSTRLSISEFDNMVTDNLLQKITITADAEGWKHFTNTVVPRIIVYQTDDGRKGAIKVKQFVKNGNQSYILADIKVQKTP